MCLIPLGGGGGCDQYFQPRFPPTPEAKQHKTKLQMVGLVHLMLIITLLFMSGGGGGFQNLITVACLFCATLNYNYCCLLIYIIYTLIDLFTNINPVGLFAQNSIQISHFPQTLSGENKAFLAVTFITCVFEVYAVNMVFQAYREFKGMEYDNLGGMGGGGLSGGVLGRAANTTGTEDRHNGNGTAFQGGGGGNSSSNNQGGGFTAF